MVELKYWGALMEITGKKGERINASNIAQVLSHIEERYGKPAHKAARCMLIAVEGTNIQLLGRFKTALKEGQTVTFLPLSGGG